MSYASLVGLPDSESYGRPEGGGAIDRWYFVRSELDWEFEIEAKMPDELWELGDVETSCEFDESVTGDTEVLVIEHLHGMYVQRIPVAAQPFPCDDDCVGCTVGRMAAHVFGVEAAIEHLL